MSTCVYHYRNSFIDIVTKDCRLLMDPWVNPANLEAWAGCEGDKYIYKTLQNKHVNFVYISHLHSDHYDENFLVNLQKKQKTKIKFLIKKFKDGRLKSKLENLGFKKQIIELEDFSKFKLNEKNFKKNNLIINYYQNFKFK